MGSVFLAEHVDTRQQVAIKVIAPHLAQIPSLAQRFEAEARAVMRIHHPNVIHFEGFGSTDDGLLYQVLELLEGDDLDQVMERHGRFSPTDFLPYLKQICAGLQAAHDRRVVHRDLKPENIFVLHSYPLTIKLLDFGIAKLLDYSDMAHLTATGTIMGSPMFMAPEQAAADKSRIGPQTDIYSLGVILYMVLCGAPPFASEDIHGMLFSHLSVRPTYIRTHDPTISRTVAEVVHRCLEKSPKDRPESARQVARDFEEAVLASRPREPSRPIVITGPGVPAVDTEVSVSVDIPPIAVGDPHATTLTDDVSAVVPLDLEATTKTEKVTRRSDSINNAVDVPLPRHRMESLPTPIPLVQRQRTGWSTTHLLALSVGLLGVAAIVLLVLIALEMLYG
jgi:serine/threonine-protein kinase